MKIYFCDGCNESVPLADVQAGEVTVIQGKLFCRNCIPPGRVGGTIPPAAAARRGTHPLVVIVLLVLVGWIVWRDAVPWLLASGEGEPRTAVVAPPTGQREPLEQVRTQIDQLAADGERRARDLTLLRADLEALRATDAEHGRALDRLADEQGRLAATQADIGTSIEKVHLNANRLDVLQNRVDSLADAVAAHETALSLQGGGAALAAAPAGGPPARPAVDSQRLALIEEVRGLLQSPEPDLRFEGVDRAADENLTELAPALVDRLTDTDMFIRLDAMKVLGDFGYEDAVPSLFDVLDDENSAIRKKAAETLVRLTGYDPGYDPKGSPAERARAVNRWREWWAAR